MLQSVSASMMLLGHEKAVTAVQVAPRTLYTPTTVYTSSADATIRIWDAESAVCKFVLVGHFDCINDLQLKSIRGSSKKESQKVLFSSSLDFCIRTWDATNGIPLQVFEVGGVSPKFLVRENRLYVAIHNVVSVWNIKVHRGGALAQ